MRPYNAARDITRLAHTIRRIIARDDKWLRYGRERIALLEARERPCFFGWAHVHTDDYEALSAVECVKRFRDQTREGVN